MMNCLYENFFYLLNNSIHKDAWSFNLEERVKKLNMLTSQDWLDLASLAIDTQTFPLLYNALATCPQNTGVNKELLEQWRIYAFKLSINQLEKHRAIHLLADRTKLSDVNIVFFKGLILADLYPHYSQRYSCDTDIFVFESEKQKAIEILEELGYTKNQTKSKKHVQVYQQKTPNNAIELHTRLWEDYSGKQITILENLDLVSETNIVKINACGIDILTLDPEKHLVYQIFHIIKHFMLDSVGIRYMIDITLFIEKYRTQINFEQFWKDIEPLEYTKFCRHFFAVCIMYFGLDESILMGRTLVIDPDTEILLMDIMNGGARYKKSASWQILGAMTPYFIREKELSKSKLKRAIDLIFLRRKDLTEEYFYAKKHLILLPIAWFHRAYRYIKGYYLNKKILYSASEKLDITQYRLHLLNRMGLINEKK